MLAKPIADLDPRDEKYWVNDGDRGGKLRAITNQVPNLNRMIGY